MPIRRNLLNPLFLASRLRDRADALLHPERPWFARRAVEYCAEQLRPGMAGFEWGSGRSTVWLASRLGSLTSIEHDPAWYGRVRRRLEASGCGNVDYRLVPLDHDPSAATMPSYAVTPQYVAVMEELPEASLDFVLVDGHYRQACILAALPRLRPGGLLVVDNTDWLPLEEWGVPGSWPRVHQSETWTSQTTVWTRPSTPARSRARASV